MTGPVRDFITWALITVGGLVAGLCGLCTAVVTVWAASDMVRGLDSSAYGPAIIMFALIMGGIPTLIGAILLYVGLRRRAAARDGARPPPSAPPPP